MDKRTLAAAGRGISILANWQQPRKYARISEEQNNAAFAKQLQLRGGRICWDGSLSLRLTKEVNPKEEVLAARGLQFWESHS